MPDEGDPFEAITSGQYVLVLTTGPGEESLAVGGLIARCCRRGRPPFLMVLGDGTSSPSALPAGHLAALHERETREAAARLGLDGGRVLMAGLYDGTLPTGGPVFEAAVAAIIQVMWRTDCNVVCAPWPGDAAQAAAHGIAAAVAARSLVGHVSYATETPPGAAGGWRLDITPHLAAKRQALAAHTALPATTPLPFELFLSPPAPA